MKLKTSLLFLLLLAILFSGCHKKVETKAEQHHKNIEQSAEAIQINTDESFDFSLIDTLNYYLGELNDSSYIFKIDRQTDEGVIGRYYIVNKKSVANVHPFEIEYNGKEYLFCTSRVNIPIKFNISIDTASLVGTYSVRTGKKKEGTLAFEKYRAPQYKIVHTSRYNITNPEEYLPLRVKKEVVYGHARGYWSSYPFKDDEKYARLILRGISKTIRERDVELAMDIYYPQDSCTLRPLFVLLHGGAFYLGDKGAETMTTWCEHFAKNGYVVASVNYRMGFNFNKQSIQKCGYAAMQDAHAAIRYLVAHADKYNIDPRYIFIGGTSAGSIAALGATFNNNNVPPSYIVKQNLHKTMGTITESSNEHHDKFKICALANMWGALYDLDDLNGHNIPVISFHGTNDNIVPFDQGIPFSDIKGKIGERLFDKMYGSKSIHQRLDSLKVRNEFYPLDGLPHSPYQDKSGHPNNIYYFIQNHIQSFFYAELIKTGDIRQDKNDHQCYYFNQDDVKNIYWKAEGGFILKEKENKVRVLWREDAYPKMLYASGIRTNSCPFEKRLQLGE